MAVSVIAVVGIIIMVVFVQQDAVTLTPDRSEDSRGCVLVIGLIGEAVFALALHSIVAVPSMNSPTKPCATLP